MTLGEFKEKIKNYPDDYELCIWDDVEKIWTFDIEVFQDGDDEDKYSVICIDTK